MNTDNFAEAAEGRADELWPYAPAGIPLSPAKRMDRRVGFRLGAQWAHDYLTAQEPSDAEVRAAKAEAWDEAHEIGWNNADEYWRCDGLIPSYLKADTYPNPYRETGDGDEHR